MLYFPADLENDVLVLKDYVGSIILEDPSDRASFHCHGRILDSGTYKPSNQRSYPLVSSNLAMENPLWMEVLFGTSLINGTFSGTPCLITGGYWLLGGSKVTAPGRKINRPMRCHGRHGRHNRGQCRWKSWPELIPNSCTWSMLMTVWGYITYVYIHIHL